MEALTYGMGDAGVAERFGGVWGDLPRGPKTRILAIGGSLKNSQDDVMSAFFADYERSFADLTAMYWIAMWPILAALMELF